MKNMKNYGEVLELDEQLDVTADLDDESTQPKRVRNVNVNKMLQDFEDVYRELVEDDI